MILLPDSTLSWDDEYRAGSGSDREHQAVEFIVQTRQNGNVISRKSLPVASAPGSVSLDPQRTKDSYRVCDVYVKHRTSNASSFFVYKHLTPNRVKNSKLIGQR